MRLTARCPRCTGTIVVTIRVDQRTDADTILARAVVVHTDTCPSPPPAKEKAA